MADLLFFRQLNPLCLVLSIFIFYILPAQIQGFRKERTHMIRLNNFMPNIEYPLQWKYSIIGRSLEHIDRAVKEVVDREYSLQFSHISSKGTYQSFILLVEVESEEMRESIFYDLKKHRDILHVL
ncbi:MAG TPA: DUF493 domain-containing protein [Caldithrix abyssi]|uniref:DUF493 domain-containing protein n=1 Tax=Caldithrix abyssi TaxID=187145 RepID=A0A7V1PUE5_CALAY|nr:DUF493 domain-containing protein [Caldithrix abyssi]